LVNFNYNLIKMEKSLFLLRGLPGAGKSTLAKTIGGLHYEADMYFVAPDGTYHFDVTRIKDAHNWCRYKVKEAMKAELPKVIVSNTFTQEWEMEAYYLLAKELGYTVFSLIVENRHNGVNEHGVPADKLEIMKNRFEIKL
jgi:tRNA A37 threonylcarbamoyladenosine biosynthesis protein TsaE